MKVLFFGDSITDMGRQREDTDPAFRMGVGYPNFIAGELGYTDPNAYEFTNRGISGNRVVDLYARIKQDVWNLSPDVLSILIGVNDVWHEIDFTNGVEIDRYERVYRALIEETKARFPAMKIILCEPYVLKGTVTEDEGRWERFLAVKEYAKVVKKLSEECGVYFLPLQGAFEKAAEQNGSANYLYDGVHPAPAGARLIAGEWIKLFREIVKK